MAKLSDFHKLERAGEGTYGVVYKANNRRDNNRLVALKQIRFDDEDEGSFHNKISLHFARLRTNTSSCYTMLSFPKLQR